MSIRILVAVKPQARKSAIKQISGADFEVSVRAPARDGKANQALIELLAEHFSVPKSAIRIVYGLSARKKLLEIG